MRLSLVAAVALPLWSCGFGRALERPDDATVVENLDANRYVYRSTLLHHAPPRRAAEPALTAPRNAREIGLIEVTVGYSGFGPEGLRNSEPAFYPRLAAIAGEMGGTHFMVLRTTRETRWDQWITSLTVSVLAEPST